jgi:hypothetical protein
MKFSMFIQPPSPTPRSTTRLPSASTIASPSTCSGRSGRKFRTTPPRFGAATRSSPARSCSTPATAPSTPPSRPSPGAAGSTRASPRAAIDAARGRGGLAVRIDECHYYAIEAGSGEVRCHARVGPFTRTTALHPVPDGAVLRLDAVPDPAGHGPDVLRLGLENGEHVAIAELDGRYLSTEVAGGFTGRVIGLYAAEGTVAFDWFEYAGCDAG